MKHVTMNELHNYTPDGLEKDSIHWTTTEKMKIPSPNCSTFIRFLFMISKSPYEPAVYRQSVAMEILCENVIGTFENRPPVTS